MAKRGGYGGMGMPNMNNLMKQAQKMQQQMMDNQKALEEKEFSGTAGGGVVEVKMNGRKELLELHIKEEVVDPEDVELLQDLIVAAINSTMEAVNEETAKLMENISGGLGGLGGGLGGLGGLPF